MPLNLKDNSLLKECCFVDGQWIVAHSGKQIAVHNPMNQSLLGQVPRMGRIETALAIEAANHAYPAWKAKPACERGRMLRRWADLMLANQEDLATIMTHEQGKPIAESRGEIAYAASFFTWFSEEAKRVYGDLIPTPQTDRRIFVQKEPIGVCAAITPWNFPAAMITRKAGPALAAGCTIVCKPATATPLSAFALAELSQRAGIPDGVFNVLTGSASEIADELTSNQLVRKVSFTGSTEIGKSLIRQSAHHVQRLSLELGGNAPFIVFDDADIEAAVEGALLAKFRNAGQTCVCANRIYVQDSVYDAFVHQFKERVSALVVGSGMDEKTQIGPMIDEDAVTKVEEHLADGLCKGAKVLCGGDRNSRGGNFFNPTVLADVDSSMNIAHEETFGPIAPIFRFHSDGQVITLANATQFGLAAYFYSRDVGRIWRIAEALEYGMIGINTGIVSTEVAPFGGMKESGNGREGSKYGIDEYIECKYICLAGLHA